MDGAPKMLRKTFSSIAKIELGTTSKARALTGHEQDSTLDIPTIKLAELKPKNTHTRSLNYLTLIRFQMSKSLDPNVPGPSKLSASMTSTKLTDVLIVKKVKRSLEQ